MVCARNCVAVEYSTMPWRLRRLARWGSVALTVLVLFCVPARAEEQAEKPFEEPGISYVTRRDAYIEWIAGTLIILACLFVAFKNPHRTHLD
jgi:hypothetical protein